MIVDQKEISRRIKQLKTHVRLMEAHRLELDSYEEALEEYQSLIKYYQSGKPVYRSQPSSVSFDNIGILNEWLKENCTGYLENCYPNSTSKLAFHFDNPSDAIEMTLRFG